MATPVLRRDDFFSVVLAGGSGSKMYPITEGLPKCLLSVGNYPVIYYPLKSLEEAGFLETLVIVRDCWLGRFKDAISALNMKIQTRFMTLPSDEEPNTASVLVSLRDKFKCDNIIVMSGDVYGSFDLKSMAALYRTREALFCAYVQPSMEEDEQTNKKSENENPYIKKANLLKSDPGSELDANKFPYTFTKEYIGFSDEGRLLVCVNDGDLDDTFTISRSLLNNYPNFTIHNDYSDLHIYMFNRCLLDFISLKSGLKNIKSDVIPYILSRQFNLKIPFKDPDYIFEDDDNIFDSASMSENIYKQKDSKKRDLLCYVYLSSSEIRSTRVNTVPSFFKANIESLKVQWELLSSFQGSVWISKSVNQLENKECMVGKNSKVSSSSNIRRSVVGVNCCIGDSVRLFNTIVMKNVTIHAKSSIVNSIVGCGAIIQSNCMIRGCVIGPNEMISSGMKLNETIVFGNELEMNNEIN